MPTTEQLRELQSKSLEEKIQISSARIMEWYTRWNGQVYVSFSGGKDSTVLLHLVRRIYPDVEGMFVDTGLEYPEIRDFVKTQNNINIVYPVKYNKKEKKYEKYVFNKVIKDYGYPIIGKEISYAISQAKKGNNWGTHKIKGEKTNGERDIYGERMIKWSYLVDAPFNISNECCKAMKKNPAKLYEKESNKKGYVGTMTEESVLRKTEWLKSGCNAFDAKRPISTPIAFWTEQDILQYIKKYNLEYASVYGDLVEDENGKLHFTGCQRTGCVFCGFGCHLEKEPNRFQRLAETHPKLYDYCINGGEYNEDGIWQPSKKGLGMGKVLDYIGVDYKPIKEGDKT